MQLLTDQMTEYIANSSWIRKMFETGIELKAQHGAENVFDFSLGNPDLSPPPAVGQALSTLARNAHKPLAFGYVPNGGLPHVRARLAESIAGEQTVDLKAEHVVITCGAAGALNALFRAVLEDGDEVVCPAPYFVEYAFYAGNHGGVLKPARTQPDTFDLDLGAMEEAITARTRVVIVNSPNNPTGRIYSSETIQALTDLLNAQSRKHGRPIFLVSDEPYRFLTYDGAEVPPILPTYEYAIVAGSFSKSLSLAGERIGYLAVRPDMPNGAELLDGLVLANRILGFVNAPVLGQHIVNAALQSGVDVGIYDARRHAMAQVLTAAGIEFFMPQGAFYFFPRVPGDGDDKAFAGRLQEQNILAVPGTGFGCPGYFRMTFCMDKSIIERSAEAFQRATRQR